MSTILLIGDNSAEMDSLEEVLGRYYYRVVRRPNARTALDAVGDVEADIVVADIDASGAKGLDFLATVRQRAPHLPVILLSGRRSMEEYLLARNLEVNVFVAKPFKAKNLERIITAIVTKRGAA